MSEYAWHRCTFLTHLSLGNEVVLIYIQSEKNLITKLWCHLFFIFYNCSVDSVVPQAPNKM